MSKYIANMKKSLLDKLDEISEKAVTFYILGHDDNPVHPSEAFEILDFDFDRYHIYEQTHFYCYTENYVISSELNDSLILELKETPLSPSACKLYFESGGELTTD